MNTEKYFLFPNVSSETFKILKKFVRLNFSFICFLNIQSNVRKRFLEKHTFTACHKMLNNRFVSLLPTIFRNYTNKIEIPHAPKVEYRN